MTLEDLENLIGTFTAIKEGSTTIENAFPPVVKEQKKVEKPDFTPPSQEAPPRRGAGTAPSALATQGEGQGDQEGRRGATNPPFRNAQPGADQSE